MASAEGQAPVAAAAEGAGAAHPAPVPESDENPSKRPRLEAEPAAAAPKAEGEGLSWNEARSVYRTQPATGEAAASALTASKPENPAAAENATVAEAAEPFVKAEVKPEGTLHVPLHHATHRTRRSHSNATSVVPSNQIVCFCARCAGFQMSQSGGSHCVSLKSALSLHSTSLFSYETELLLCPFL